MNKELEKFKLFKRNYQYQMPEIEEIEGEEYCLGKPLKDEEGRTIGDCDKWINVGYKHKGSYAKVLSNLFPYEFEFREKKLKSIESFFQGIKFKNKEMQDLVFNYSALPSNNIKACSEYDWKKAGIIYWQEEPIDRYSQKYDDIVDELYISAIQNPLYRNILKETNRQILHTIGEKEKSETVFTRYKFEKELNCLKDFLKGEQ